MAAMVASSTPATAPRQPAWAAPTIARRRIGEQNRRAIGGDDAQRQTGPVGDHGVGFLATPGRPGLGRGDHMRAMHLGQTEQTAGIEAE